MISTITDATDGDDDDDDALPGRRNVEPFPTGIVVILTLTATVYTYTLASLFPYVGLMVSHLLELKTTNEAGYYAGYVASSFTFGRILSGYVWGHFADACGRKPTVIIGLLSMQIFSLAFGLSTSYAQALSSRLLLGLTNGIVPALRISLKETCGPEHVVTGMAYLSSCKSIGMIVGTGVGGLLSQPAVHYPGSFSATGLFGRFPFLLPNLVGAICALAVMVLVITYLPETNVPAATLHGALSRVDRYGATDARISSPSSDGTAVLSPTDTSTASYQRLEAPVTTTAVIDDNDNGSGDRWNTGRSEGVDCEEGGAKSEKRAPGDGHPLSTARDRNEDNKEDGEIEAGGEEGNARGGFGRDGLLGIPNVKLVLFLACAVQAIQIGLNEAYPLFALSTVDVGGLGWNALQIGQVLISAGVAMAVFQLGIFPSVVKAVGLTAGQRVGFVSSALAFVAIPSGKSICWNRSSMYAVFVVAIATINCSLSAVVLALSIGSTTLVSPGMRGKLGGLYNTAESFGNCVGPAGFATVYAWSISSSGRASAYGWIDYHLVFYASALVLLVCASLAWRTLTHERMMKT
eukprot:g5273.t1